MILNDYIIAFIAALLGQLLHIIVEVVKSKTQAKAANLQFSLKEYLQDNSLAICANLIAIIIFVFILTDIKDYIVKYLKFTYIFLGFSGSSLLLSWLDKYNKKITNIVDVKTNIADEVLTNGREQKVD